MSDLEGKVILITGASSGLGALLAEQVVHHGGKPVLIARSEEKLKRVCRTIYEKYHRHIHYFTADISDIGQVNKVFTTILSMYPSIDILVNNAGFGIFRSFVDTPAEDFRRMIEVNYLGTVYCTKHVLPFMLQRNKGQIINVASQAGKMGLPKTSAYAASKHAILGLSNSLRYEVRPYNIHITTVNPGPIRTPFHDIADSTGMYVQNVSPYILSPQHVVEQIIQVMIHPRREINLPKWMDIGSRLFMLFPRMMDKFFGKQLDRKE